MKAHRWNLCIIICIFVEYTWTAIHQMAPLSSKIICVFLILAYGCHIQLIHSFTYKYRFYPTVINIAKKKTKKIIGSDIHTSVYDKRDDFGFPIVNYPWLSGDVPRLPSYGIYISQLVRFARCCTSVLDFHSKNLQITSKLLTQGYRYHKLRKTFGKFFRSYSELLSKFNDISF